LKNPIGMNVLIADSLFKSYKLPAKLPEEIITACQDTADLLINLGEFKCALILRAQGESVDLIAVSQASKNSFTSENPIMYEELCFYCKKIISSQAGLAREDKINEISLFEYHSEKSPDFSSSCIPLSLPGGTLFGAMCVVQGKHIKFSEGYQQDILKLGRLLEGRLKQEAMLSIISQQENFTNKERIRFEQINHELKNFFDVNLDLLCIADTNGNFIRVNRAWGTILGYPADALEGRKFLDFVHPEDLAATHEAIKKLDQQKRIYNFINRYRASDGSYRFIEWRSNPSGEKIYAAARDITDRINSERLLFEQKQQYETIFNESQNAILILDVENKEIIAANPQALEHFGASNLQEVQQSKAIKQLFSCNPLYTNREFEILKKIEIDEKDGSQAYEYLFRNLKGEMRWDMIRMTPVIIHGQKRTMVTGVDITARKQAEEQYAAIREKAEISSRLATLGEMVAGISHEINNPLTSIVGFSSFLEEEDLPEHVSEQIKIISQSSQRIKEIVTKMLTFSRQTRHTKTANNIHQLIDNCLDLQSYTLNSANIKIIKKYSPVVPHLMIDAGQIQQAILNILLNAEYAVRKACRDEGIIVITTAVVGEALHISFRDNGVGMTSEAKAKIFQPFYTTKGPGEGTGLGMALTRSIVLDHEGAMEIESIGGEGVVITMVLPLIPATGSDEAIMKEQVEIHTGKTEKEYSVLVVDEEPMITYFVRKTLEKEGYRVKELNSSADVCDVMREYNYDIVLMDIRMPGTSGIDLYNKIQSECPELIKKLIFITSDNEESAAQRFLVKNQLPFITKPFDREELNAVVQRVAGRE
jgi:PAS domain S-box-containing protein